MKKYILTALVCFITLTHVSSQQAIKSERDFKSYFDKQKGSIDFIEGIYNLSFESNALNTNRYTGIQNNKKTELKSKCIIYKTGDSYKVYVINYPEVNSFLTSTASPAKFLFSWGVNSDMELYMDNSYTLKANCNQRIDEGKAQFADISWKYVFTKIYPNDTDYKSAVPEKEQKSTGTGFAVSANGYIVTNYHVIDKANSIKVRGVNNDFTNSYTAKVIVSDKNNDLAIIQIIDSKFSGIPSLPFSIRNSTVDVGEDIFVLGYPLTASMGEEIKLTTGIISARSGFQGDITTYQMTAPIQPGNSGAPVFDKNGLLIAVTNAKHLQAENAGYAIKTNYLKNLIESLPTNITFQTTNLLQSKPLTEQVKVLKKFVYIIEIN